VRLCDLPSYARAVGEGHGCGEDGWNVYGVGWRQDSIIQIGQGTPVILIHGYTGSTEGNWFANGVADALAKNHRVVAIDCRNHGKSDKPQPN